MHNGNYGTAPPTESFDGLPYDINPLRDFNCSQCTMAITVRRHLQKHLKIYPRILQHTKGRQRLNMYGQAGRQAGREALATWLQNIGQAGVYIAVFRIRSGSETLVYYELLIIKWVKY